jgi:hypothetical protein
MWVCVPCDRRYHAWRKFKEHMLNEHQVNERNLLRRVAQLEAVDIFAVRSDSGQWMIYGQPEFF